MLDFRHNRSGRAVPPPTNHRRLLLMVLALGLVLILYDHLREPNSGLELLFERLTTPVEDSDSGGIDTRLASIRPSDLASDSFQIVPDHSAEEKKDSTEDEKNPSAKARPSEPSGQGGRGDEYFPGVRPEMFKSIRDDSFSSQAEQSVALPLLNILNRTDPARLREASLGHVAYAQLFRQPEHYRGRLVTVSGTVRRVNPIELYPNEYGLREYYEVWLFPVDNPSTPIVIYCLYLPEGFPTGMTLAQEAEATGFFLKRWAYAAKDGFRSAPMMLARSLEWHKRPVVARAPAVDTLWITVVVAGSALTALAAAWLIYLRTRPRPLPIPEKNPDFELIGQMDQTQPSHYSNDGEEP